MRCLGQVNDFDCYKYLLVPNQTPNVAKSSEDVLTAFATCLLIANHLEFTVFQSSSSKKNEVYWTYADEYADLNDLLLTLLYLLFQ